MSTRVEQLMVEMSLDEKASLTSGTDMWHGTGVPRLGFRGLKVTDGPNGARGAHFVGTTSACLPCGTALGATWNPELIGELGHLLGREARSKGADVLLAPTVNIHRSPLAGRNFECPSEDPWLTSRIAVAYITGVQAEGVGCAVKHLVANDSEFERHTISSEVDERTLREMLLPPFEAAVTEARTMSLMTAYNRLDGVYCTEHPWLMDRLEEWGFDGFVISDWWSAHSTIGTGRHGCDLEMPGPARHLGPALAESVRAGENTEAHVDAKVRRLLGVMERLGVLDSPEHTVDASTEAPGDRALLRRAAAEAVVLLTNNGVLPIDPSVVRRVAVIGPNSDVAITQGGGSAAVTPHHVVTVLDGLRTALGPGVEVTHSVGCDAYRNAPAIDPRWISVPGSTEPGAMLEYFANRQLEGEPTHRMTAATTRMSWLGDPWDGVPAGNFSARLSATFRAPTDGDWTLTLVSGGQGRLLWDGEHVLDMWDHWEPGTAFFGLGSAEIRHTVTLRAGEAHELVAEFTCVEGLGAAGLLVGCLPPLGHDPITDAARAAADADVAIVVVGLNADWETEGEDRTTMDLPGEQEALIVAVAAAQPKTVVLVNAGSPVSMGWVDEVAACAQIWYLGQETGDAVADVVLGRSEPGGRLPTTFAMRYEDHPAMDDYPGANGEVRYGEGIFMGYRGYDQRSVVPRFAFGHGLSYTEWDLQDAALSSASIGPDDGVEVSLVVRNVGRRDGSTVVQCYVSDLDSSVDRPAKELKAFAKVSVPAGESQRVSMSLSSRSFAFWDADQGGWKVEPGRFTIRLGTASDLLPIDLSLTVEGLEPAS